MQEDEDHTNKEPDKSPQALHANRKRNDTIHMKILVPSGAVGAIIGKGGESIAQVQWETGARIKLSKPNDFYPGTVERVCLIQGTLEGVTRMHNYIMDRMLEKPECTGTAVTPGPVGSIGRPSGDSTASPGTTTASTTTTSAGLTGDTGTGIVWTQTSSAPGSRLPWGRHQQVKILVPNCTAGLVIGKMGTYVKEIKDRTGAFIQISQKSREINLLERCITIAGEPDQCRAAVALVLAKIAEDPQSTSCPTISYSRVQGPVASAYPNGSPFAFASLPRFPAGAANTAGAAAHLVRENVVPAAGYFPLVDPYTSPMLQAALLQATALAATFNQRGIGGVSYYQPGTCMTTSPPAPAQTGAGTQQTQTIPQSTSCQSQAAGHSNVPIQSGHQIQSTFFPTEQSPPGPETGLYAAATAAQLLSGGGLWNTASLGGEPTWGTGESAAQSGYEASYPQMNFAYYPANQSAVLASLASRNPCEASTVGFAGGGPTGAEFYPTSIPYATSVQFGPPLGSTIRVTSPGATVYQAANTHQSSMFPVAPPPDRMPVGMVGGAGAPAVSQNTASQAIQLSDLLNSLRLGTAAVGSPTAPAPYLDFNPAEFGQVYATLSQHGLFNVPGLGAYPLLTTSSSGPMPIPDAARPQTMGSGRMVAAPTGFGVAMGTAQGPHLIGSSGAVPRFRPPAEAEAVTYYASAQQQPMLAVKRRVNNTTTTGSESVGLRQSVTLEQLAPGKAVGRAAADVRRPASCYLPQISGEPEQSAIDPVVHSSLTSVDSRNEETDQPLSDPSISDQSLPGVPVDSRTSSEQSQRSASPPTPAPVISCGDTEPLTAGTPTTETNGDRGPIKHVLNGGPITAVTRTPNGVKK